MPVTIELPEEIKHQLEEKWGDLPRRALEAVALEGYRSEALSAGQVAEMLGLSSWDAEVFLSSRGAGLRYAAEDLREDLEVNRRVLSG
jgi:predicted HTH domain antitoxin